MHVKLILLQIKVLYYMYICITWVRTLHIHRYAYMYVQNVHAYTAVHMYMHTYMHVYMSSIYVCMCVQAYIDTYVQAYVHACTKLNSTYMH